MLPTSPTSISPPSLINASTDAFNQLRKPEATPATGITIRTTISSMRTRALESSHRHRQIPGHRGAALHETSTPGHRDIVGRQTTTKLAYSHGLHWGTSHSNGPPKTPGETSDTKICKKSRMQTRRGKGDDRGPER